MLRRHNILILSRFDSLFKTMKLNNRHILYAEPSQQFAMYLQCRYLRIVNCMLHAGAGVSRLQTAFMCCWWAGWAGWDDLDVHQSLCCDNVVV